MQQQVLSDAQWLKCSAYLTAATGRTMTADQLEVYFELLNDIPYEVLKQACSRVVQGQKDNWLPSVGAIRAVAAELVHGVVPSWSDEWDRVRRLVHDYSLGRKSEAYALMPLITQQAVTAVGWASICDSETISMHAAQFRTAYESLAARETSMRQISVELRPRITAGPSVSLALKEPQKPALVLVQDFAAKLPTVPAEEVQGVTTN